MCCDPEHVCEYVRIEKNSESGIRIFLEFPKHTEADAAGILQEVRKILSGALKERLAQSKGGSVHEEGTNTVKGKF